MKVTGRRQGGDIPPPQYNRPAARDVVEERIARSRAQAQAGAADEQAARLRLAGSGCPS